MCFPSILCRVPWRPSSRLAVYHCQKRSQTSVPKAHFFQPCTRASLNPCPFCFCPSLGLIRRQQRHTGWGAAPDPCETVQDLGVGTHLKAEEAMARVQWVTQNRDVLLVARLLDVWEMTHEYTTLGLGAGTAGELLSRMCCALHPFLTSNFYTLFTPAPWSFAIWGIIFIWENVFVVYQALPSERNNKVPLATLCTGVGQTDCKLHHSHLPSLCRRGTKTSLVCNFD